MPNDPELREDGKNAHERFTELGKRLMSVPKAEVDRRDEEWQKRKRAKSRSKKRR